MRVVVQTHLGETLGSLNITELSPINQLFYVNIESMSTAWGSKGCGDCTV